MHANFVVFFVLFFKEMCRLDNPSWFTVCFSLRTPGLLRDSDKKNLITSFIKGISGQEMLHAFLKNARCINPATEVSERGKKRNKTRHLINDAFTKYLNRFLSICASGPICFCSSKSSSSCVFFLFFVFIYI